MNVQSIKSELQEVLDNDVVLRKEFNELKRSLSDYRNQLIMRDEDCKRLQVTIDVLNTKLVVMERDNNNYKAELTAFKELRGTIKDQLQAKQEEIEARLAEIQSLKDDLNSIVASYESKIEEIQNENTSELTRVKDDFNAQIIDLKTNTHYKEAGIKEEFENRASELAINWADREQSLVLMHEEEIIALNSAHVLEVNNLSSHFENQLSEYKNASEEEVLTLKQNHQIKLTQLEESLTASSQGLEQNFQSEITNLRIALEEQRSTLTNNFNTQVESLTQEFTEKENRLSAGYENQILELNKAHELILTETVSSHEVKTASIINEYEEKLSNTLIHSNSQNSKLNEELAKAQLESDRSVNVLGELAQSLEVKTAEVENLSAQLNDLELRLLNEADRNTNLNSEFELFKQNASLSASEQVNELNNQIAGLNLSHSDYVNELSNQIENLNTELTNLGLLFEATTNHLSEAESVIAQKTNELTEAYTKIELLNNELSVFTNSISEKESELENFKSTIELSSKEEILAKEIEYQKLLAENSNLIEEIDLAQDKVEAQEAEITLLKGELEEVRIQSLGKSDYFKETLANKNFEITNLEANHAAMVEEITQLKNEVSELKGQLSNSLQSSEALAEAQNNYNLLNNEKQSLLVEMDVMQTVISGLNESVVAMNEKIANYETEIESLRNNAKVAEQEAFIDRLFMQIDGLNDQRLALLDEKEQMANQLLKMNEVIGNISQQVDSERIDVTDLNSHRKNIILANNSDAVTEKPQMKKQINDLVREIDKCIALLSA